MLEQSRHKRSVFFISAGDIPILFSSAIWNLCALIRCSPSIMKTKISKGITEILDWMLPSWFRRKCCVGLVAGSREEPEQFDAGGLGGTRCLHQHTKA
ncbi:hypothetical protein C2845_PM06G32780 [Panicum miliaceum]|uniref:Uncharacterized protein n=1 Tax=Panicum miliaceum TaxID=4540 RepID=A0A3L6R652_PANMI|nr:hypothetical protein C2845_PM06G32780 [Panicum miliaceum]